MPWNIDPENRVVRFRKACEIAGISPQTMRKLVKEKKGPRVLRLSERCLGVRRNDLEAWLAEREDTFSLPGP